MSHPSRFTCTRPSLEALEDRLTPTLSVLSLGSTLSITGTPTAGPAQPMLVQGVGGDNFQVLDGTADLGTFHAARDLRLDLSSVADGTRVQVDLAGDSLPGSLAVNVGSGNPVVEVLSSTGTGTVGGDVLFNGGSGTEDFLLGSRRGGALQVGGNVRAASVPVTVPIEDYFVIFPRVEVHGNVSTTRLTYTEILSATVDGNVSAQAIDTPGGIGLEVDGTVHGNVTATGGATAPGFFSFANVGNVDGNVTLDLTDGFVVVNAFGSIGGNLRVSAADGVSTAAFLEGTVGGSAFLDLGGSAGTFSNVELTGTVAGSMSVSSRSGSVDVAIGINIEEGTGFAGVIGGGLNVHLGGGANGLTIDGADGSSVGGTVVYVGGTGADAVAISGQNSFRLIVHAGGGNDTVSFAPDARVAFALIDFGPGPGTKTWVPPAVIDFPLVLLNYP